MSPDTVKWLSDNWAALTAAPWVFSTLALVMAAVGYTIGTWFKREQIAILERRIAEYEAKLKVGSPEEAKTKVDRLKRELAETQPTRAPSGLIISPNIVLKPARESKLVPADKFFSRAEKERIVDTMNYIQQRFNDGRKMMWEAERVSANPGHNEELEASIERFRAIYVGMERLNIDFDKIRNESDSYPISFATLLAAKPIYSEEFERAVRDHSDALTAYRHFLTDSGDHRGTLAKVLDSSRRHFLRAKHHFEKWMDECDEEMRAARRSLEK